MHEEIRNAVKALGVYPQGGVACVEGVGGRRGRRRRRALARKGYVNHVALEIAERKERKARVAAARAQAQLDILNKQHAKNNTIASTKGSPAAKPVEKPKPAAKSAKPKDR